mmetsp:Transcript_1627/g.10020  ORF Transcript_1627/g.10020 Transcript_1627/m.10020 type:complete len:235 (-) Transcript_1627:19-723(-)
MTFLSQLLRSSSHEPCSCLPGIRLFLCDEHLQQLHDCLLCCFSSVVFHDFHHGVFRRSLHVHVFVCEHGTRTLQELLACFFVVSSDEVSGEFWDPFGHGQPHLSIDVVGDFFHERKEHPSTVFVFGCFGCTCQSTELSQAHAAYAVSDLPGCCVDGRGSIWCDLPRSCIFHVSFVPHASIAIPSAVHVDASVVQLPSFHRHTHKLKHTPTCKNMGIALHTYTRACTFAKARACD